MTPPLKQIPHFNVHTTAYEALEEFGGHEAVLYRSANGSRMAGSYRESGRHTVKQDFDEFIYVIAGSAEVTVEGHEPVLLQAGDCCYLLQGLEVTYEMSEDFHDVAVLVSDSPIDY